MTPAKVGRGIGTGSGRRGRGLTEKATVAVPPQWRAHARSLARVEADGWREIIVAGLVALGKDPT